MADVRKPTDVENITLNMDRLRFAAAVLQGAPTAFQDTRIPSLDPSTWIAAGRSARAEFVKQMEAAGFPGFRIRTEPLEVSIGSSDPLGVLILTALATYAREERAARAADPRFSVPDTSLDERTRALTQAAQAATRLPQPGPGASLAEMMAFNDQRLAEIQQQGGQ